MLAGRWRLPVELLSNDKLEKLWKVLRRDNDGARALRVLKRAGFDLDSIGDARSWIGTYTWSEVIVSIPFLPNRRARSRRLPRLSSARPVIQLLRELAQATEDPYSDVSAHDKRKRTVYRKAAITAYPWKKVVDFLELVFSRNWEITQFNPYKYTLASLRWAVRLQTGKSHDNELIDLIDAAYRAAGENGFHMKLVTFNKIETHDRNTRAAGARKLLGPRLEA
jgi:hypothetical protein